MDGDVIEGQRPAGKRPGLKQRQIVNENAIGRRQQCADRADEWRIDPERGFLILMIELGSTVDRMRKFDWMMRFEMSMNELGVAVIVRLADVHVLGRQQRQPEQAERRDQRESGAERH